MTFLKVLENIMGRLFPTEDYLHGPEQSSLDTNVGANLLEWPRRSTIAVDIVKRHLPVQVLSVADYGCGRQTVRALLPSRWEYVPFDYCSRSADTVICDFTTSLPAGFFDLIICLGVLEYMDDPFRLLHHAVKQGRHVVFSYNGPTTEERRKLQGWKNCLSLKEIEDFLEEERCAIIQKLHMDKNEWIYLVKAGMAE